MKRSRNTALALLLIALFLALEYAWVETPHSRRERGGRGGSGLLTSLGRPGCPADPQQRRDLGAADMNWKLKKLDGTEITFAQFRGKLAVVGTDVYHQVDACHLQEPRHAGFQRIRDVQAPYLEPERPQY